MAEKRESKRVVYRKPVRYGPSLPPQYKGVVADLSETGIYISTNNVFKPGTKLYMVIEDGCEVYIIEGFVKSAKKVPPSLARSVKCGMGVAFLEPHEELKKIYLEKRGC